MLPGNAVIVKCPYCGTTKELMTLTSGNTFGATFWSDNKRIAPMLPRVSPVQKCPGCGKYYLEYNNRCGMSDGWSFERGELTFPEWKEAYTQFQKESIDADDLCKVRYWLIQSYNDYYYRSEDAPEPSEEDFELFSKTIVEFIDSAKKNLGLDLLLEAEFYREANMMKECRTTLDSIQQDQLDEFQKRAFDGIKERMEKNDKVVFEITPRDKMK